MEECIAAELLAEEAWLNSRRCGYNMSVTCTAKLSKLVRVLEISNYCIQMPLRQFQDTIPPFLPAEDQQQATNLPEKRKQLFPTHSMNIEGPKCLIYPACVQTSTHTHTHRGTIILSPLMPTYGKGNNDMHTLYFN